MFSGQATELDRLVEVFCQALTEAYEQVNSLAVDDTVHRLAKVLLRLAGEDWPLGPDKTWRFQRI